MRACNCHEGRSEILGTQTVYNLGRLKPLRGRSLLADVRLRLSDDIRKKRHVQGSEELLATLCDVSERKTRALVGDCICQIGVVIQHQTLRCHIRGRIESPILPEQAPDV